MAALTPEPTGQPAGLPLLTWTLAALALDRLTLLAQRGFLIALPTPMPLRQVLLGLPGFDSRYLEREVQTLFINQSASDDLDQLIHPGWTVALSGPMPGLAGAIFRRGGHHASLRSRTATLSRKTTDCGPWLTLKLFNRIARDRAGTLLENGVVIRGHTLARFLRRQGHRFQDSSRRFELEGQALAMHEVSDLIHDLDALTLRIREEQP